ncbi:MAG: hypothetical protein FAF03_04745 [Epsilonproteobacteria bacterium]|nr:hypothetical protein [Campylobacterota bacterium]
MKKTLLITLSTLTFTTLFSACGQVSVPTHTNTEEECLTVQRNLYKVEKFTDTVEKTSAFHLEEAAVAMNVPKITVSNNKRQMLRDAAKRKKSLEAEQKELGCKIATN